MNEPFEKKESTHIVLKIDDINRCLTREDRAVLGFIADKIAMWREAMGKESKPQYYVVNKDELYADLVFEIIKLGESAK